MVVDGVRTIIAVGDSVFLRSSEYDDNHGAKKSLAQEVAFVARVERMWEEPGRKKLREDRMKIRARWFFKVCEHIISSISSQLPSHYYLPDGLNQSNYLKLG
jgi:hypothetical protein